MTSAEIRQSFLDFFREKQHTIVPSASLLPQSPGLLFTNAGMNQFVPYFLGTEQAPYNPPRAADTQKCIRAGGKHNDLEDVGYDTYHHTMFEMLGNWSFGNYFKAEAIAWAWELIVERWGLPAHRLYASVYAPKEGDPGNFDQEAYDIWAELFRSKGCDPAIQIVHGNVKDNFWMMGETGPCGPCSELHIDLTPEGNPVTGRNLVNNDSDLCIEIWNLVFIQYNAEADGTFRELPAKHIDTGMGFERACSIIQNTNRFTDFSRKPSNYATDVFTPIFRTLEQLSGKTYSDIYPALGADRANFSEEMKDAVAFRVIADHLRTLSFSIADGILPGNNGRNYVLRRILRRAVRYGRQLGFSGEKPFFAALVPTLVEQMSNVFPELKTRQNVIEQTLAQEETSFNQTLDRGLKRFEEATNDASSPTLSGEDAFELYDTYGFPIDLTELLCAERALKLDMPRFEELMEQQRERARAAQKSTIVRALDLSTDAVTEFVGFENDTCEAKILEVHPQGDAQFIITDRSVFFAEMGGQAGDIGTLTHNGEIFQVEGVQQIGKARALILPADASLSAGQSVPLSLSPARRRSIEAHHTATHLLHWALHEVVSHEATQQGSSVDENRLRFDFNSTALTPAQLAAMEEKINASIAAGDSVSWQEVPHADIQSRADIMQFFGDKYGDIVRVVQIGGTPGALDGYSMELCGGTHVRNTRELQPFFIKSESAIASGVRRIEAVCGSAAITWLNEEKNHLLAEISQLSSKAQAALEKLASTGAEISLALPKLAEPAGLPELRAHLAELKHTNAEAEKAFKKQQARAAAQLADEALTEQIAANAPFLHEFEADASLAQEWLNGLKKKQFEHAACLIVDDAEKLHLAVYCGAAAQSSGLKAGDILRELAQLGDGKGGGGADQARGAAPNRDKKSAIADAARAKLGL